MKKNLDKLIVNLIYNNIKNNYIDLYESYQFKTKNQKYSLRFILHLCTFKTPN